MTFPENFDPMCIRLHGYIPLCGNSVYVLFIIFKIACKFLTKFWYSGQMFSSDIFTLLCLKSEKSAHAQLAITRLYILFANFMTWYQLESYIKDTHREKVP